LTEYLVNETKYSVGFHEWCLNSRTLGNVRHTKAIWNILERVRQSSVLSKLDLSKGFHLVLIAVRICFLSDICQLGSKMTKQYISF